MHPDAESLPGAPASRGRSTLLVIRPDDRGCGGHVAIAIASTMATVPSCHGAPDRSRYAWSAVGEELEDADPILDSSVSGLGNALSLA